MVFNLMTCRGTELAAAMAGPWESWSYGGRKCVRFLPTRLMRRRATVLLNYGGRDIRWRAGDSGMTKPRLADGEGELRWFFIDGEGTYGCGGPWRSSRGSWVGLGSGEPVQRRWARALFLWWRNTAEGVILLFLYRGERCMRWDAPNPILNWIDDWLRVCCRFGFFPIRSVGENFFPFGLAAQAWRCMIGMELVGFSAATPVWTDGTSGTVAGRGWVGYCRGYTRWLSG
jgi:hypothetical protein